MAKATNKPQPEKRIAAKIHRCNRSMFVVPDQRCESDESFDSYAIVLKDVWGYAEPSGVSKSSFGFCPYCGEKLIEIHEVPTQQD